MRARFIPAEDAGDEVGVVVLVFGAVEDYLKASSVDCACSRRVRSTSQTATAWTFSWSAQKLRISSRFRFPVPMKARRILVLGEFPRAQTWEGSRNGTALTARPVFRKSASGSGLFQGAHDSDFSSTGCRQGQGASDLPGSALNVRAFYKKARQIQV